MAGFFSLRSSESHKRDITHDRRSDRFNRRTRGTSSATTVVIRLQSSNVWANEN